VVDLYQMTFCVSSWHVGELTVNPLTQPNPHLSFDLFISGSVRD